MEVGLLYRFIPVRMIILSISDPQTFPQCNNATDWIIINLVEELNKFNILCSMFLYTDEQWKMHHSVKCCRAMKMLTVMKVLVTGENRMRSVNTVQQRKQLFSSCICNTQQVTIRVPVQSIFVRFESFFWNNENSKAKLFLS